MPDPRPTPATVVICAYTLDRLEETIASVRSALDQVPAPDRLVLVVDHNDALLARLRARLAGETAAGTVAVVPNAHGRGLSGARNTGIAEATGELVAFLDDDALAAPGWLAGLTRPFAHPDVLGAGGVALPVWAEGAQPGWFPDAYHWVVGCSYEGQTLDGPVRNVLGCSMAFRRDLLVELAGFDPAVGRLGSLPLGCEETELCIRGRRLHPGGTVVAVPDAVVHHTVAAARHRPAYFLRRCFYEGISKAVLVRLAEGEAVASERTYTARVLPRAFLRSLGEALDATRHLRSPLASLGRALAVVGGLAAAGLGFAVGLVVDRLRSRDPFASRDRLATSVAGTPVGDGGESSAARSALR